MTISILERQRSKREVCSQVLETSTHGVCHSSKTSEPKDITSPPGRTSERRHDVATQRTLSTIRTRQPYVSREDVVSG